MRLDSRRKPSRTVLDWTVGTVGAVALTPIILVLACVSWVTYRAHPFFVQDRIGHNGQPFRFVKIRSLPRHTPEYLRKDRLGDIENNTWGRFIRTHHLDELPQIWHVVTGSMSLVGPRPEMPNLENLIDENHRNARQSVLPGCTGLWQISMASAGMINESPEYDIHYVANRSLRLDLWILLKTFAELTGRPPIGSLDAIPTWARSSGRAVI